MQHKPQKGAMMEHRRVAMLLPFAVTAAVFVVTFGMLRVSGGGTGTGRGTPLTGDTEAVETRDVTRELPPGPAAGTLGAPVFTRFDVALLVLGGLGLIGVGRWMPGVVAATPLGGLRRLRPGYGDGHRPRVRYLPVVVLGVLVLTATGAFAQTQPTGSPYVGAPPDAESGTGSAPYVGTTPGQAVPPLDGGVYVDPVSYVTPLQAHAAGTLTVAGRTLPRAPAAGEPALLEAATEDPREPVAAMPVTVGDMVGVVLLTVAALLVVLVPRRRCR
jgi:hypothetical protein